MRDSFRVSRTPALLRTQTQVNSIRKNRSWITSSDANRWDEKMAAPAEPRTPNLHRAKSIAPRECEWKHGDSGSSAREKTMSHKAKTESP